MRGEAVQASASAPTVPLAGDQPVEVSFEVLLAKTRTAGTLALRAGAQGLQSIQGRIEASGPASPPSRKSRATCPRARPTGSRRKCGTRTGAGASRIEAQPRQIRRARLGSSRHQPRPAVRQRRARIGLLRPEGNRIEAEVKEKLEEEYLFPRAPWPSDKLDALDAEVSFASENPQRAPGAARCDRGARAARERQAKPQPARRQPRERHDQGPGRVRCERVSRVGERVPRYPRPATFAPRSFAEAGRDRARSAERPHPALRPHETPAKLLGSSNGQILFAAQGGQASALLVEILGLDAAEAVTLLGKKTAKQPLRCAVVKLQVKDGTAKTAPFVIDATDTVLSVEGTLPPEKGKINLTARAEPRDASPFTLRTPADIAGTFLDPQIKPHKGPLVARGAAALALAAVNRSSPSSPSSTPAATPRVAASRRRNSRICIIRAAHAAAAAHQPQGLQHRAEPPRAHGDRHRAFGATWEPQQRGRGARALLHPLDQQMGSVETLVRQQTVHVERILLLLQAARPDKAAIEEETKLFDQRGINADQVVDSSLRLIEEAMAAPDSGVDRVALALFKQRLPDIQTARQNFHGTFRQFLAEAEEATRSLKLVRDSLVREKDAVNRQLEKVITALGDTTQAAADRARAEEQRAIRLNWAITAIAAVLGLLLAALITLATSSARCGGSSPALRRSKRAISASRCAPIPPTRSPPSPSRSTIWSPGCARRSVSRTPSGSTSTRASCRACSRTGSPRRAARSR